MPNQVLPMPAVVLTLSLLALPASAGVPAPAGTDGIPCGLWERSVFELAPGPLPCQYRFRADGWMDELAVVVTLRDCFDNPVTDCLVQATLRPNAGTLALCSCEDSIQVAASDAVGATEFHFARLGGRGSLSIALTAICAGNIGLPDLEADFTSPDMNGSCDPGSATNIVDLALWANGLSGYSRPSDLDCNGVIELADLALWASGIGVGCP